MCYLSIVQIEKTPLRGSHLKVCVMSLAVVANFERFLDRVAPIALLGLGLASAGAIALIGG